MNKTFLSSMLGVALLSAAALPAGAGTAVDPEYTDPAGDVPFVLTGENADWADITGAWFEPITDGVRLNIAAVSDANASGEDVQFYVNWDVLAGQAEHCWANMYVNVSDGDEATLNARNAELNYTCADEKHPFTIPIADVTIETAGMWDGGTFPIATNGNVTSVDIPFSVFTEGATASLYGPGTGLQLTSVSSQMLFDQWFFPADQRDLCRPSYTPPFGFESGCPEDARVYEIG